MKNGGMPKGKSGSMLTKKGTGFGAKLGKGKGMTGSKMASPAKCGK